MAKKTVRVAVWEYFDKSKPPRRRLAYFGQEVDLSAAEQRRADAAGVFDQPDPVPSPFAPPPPADVVDVDADAADADDVDTDVIDAGTADTDAGAGDDLADLDTTGTADGGDQPDGVTAMVKPPNTAPAEVWVDYAVAQGLDRADAEKMSRADLIKALA